MQQYSVFRRFTNLSVSPANDEPQLKRSTISVLMSTYAGDSPENLLVAVRSIIEQTLKPLEIVIVVDGPLPLETHRVLNILENEAKAAKITWKAKMLPANVGVANALNAGLDLLRGDFVARMDADDFALPQRFEKQLAYLENNQNVDVLFTAQGDFYKTHTHVDAIKTVPTEHDQIISLLRWRNIISHPTVMLARKLLSDVGGYRAIPFLEDYDMYMRMLEKGARFGALPEAMVNVRVDQNQVRRRGGLRYAIVELRFRFNLLRSGTLKFHQWLITTPLYFGFRIAPPFLKWRLYRLVRKIP